MLSSVAIASKWDEPEKIKVFIVSTVGRNLSSRKAYLQKNEKRHEKLMAPIKSTLFNAFFY